MNKLLFKIALPLLLSLSYFAPNENDINASKNAKNIMPCSIEHLSSTSDIVLSESEKDAIEHNAAVLAQMALDGQVLEIPVRAIVFDGDDVWDTVLDSSEIAEEINAANTKYSNEGFNVKLVFLDYARYINEDLHDGYTCSYSNPNSQWILCDQPTFWDYTNGTYGASGYLNLFYLNLIGPSQHANFPTSLSHDRANTVILNEDYLYNGWSVMHELGHTFGLYHTFETANGTKVESVTRDPNDSCYDCEEDGDRICDTPAAINLEFGDPDHIGIAGGGDEDECGAEFSMWYNDNPTGPCGDALIMNKIVYENIMNYGSRWCSQDFTDGQVARMWEFMPTKVSQLDMTLVGHCDFVNINLGTETVQNGQYIETPKEITSQQTISSWDHQLNLYGADEGVTLLPGFQATSSSNFKAVPIADGCY